MLAWNILLFKPTQTEIDRMIFEKAKYKILPGNFDLEELLKGEDKETCLIYAKKNSFNYLLSIQKDLEKVPKFNQNLNIF